MAPDAQRFLIFYMHGLRYAFDLKMVAEVMDLCLIWPIPFAPSYYGGAINFHGSIVPVMDLQVFLDPASTTKPSKIIVLDVKNASLAFLVESVARIAPVTEIEFLDAPDVRFAAALLNLPEGGATLLDIHAILSEAEMVMNG